MLLIVTGFGVVVAAVVAVVCVRRWQKALTQGGIPAGMWMLVGTTLLLAVSLVALSLFQLASSSSDTLAGSPAPAAASPWPVADPQSDAEVT